MTVHCLPKFVVAGVLSAALLSGCGGGGGDAGAAPVVTPPNLNFALSTGYQAHIASGSDDNFTLSGSCGGTATIKTDPVVVATFEGVNGFSSAQVSTVSFNNCSTTAPRVTGKTYYTATYTPIGLAIDGGEYAKYETLPTGLPASVKVGATGTIVTYLSYNDNTQAVRNGKRILTYIIEEDASKTTAILNLVTTSVDLAGATQSVQQSRYHMAESGALTLASITVDFNDAAKTKLVFTPK